MIHQALLLLLLLFFVVCLSGNSCFTATTISFVASAFVPQRNNNIRSSASASSSTASASSFLRRRHLWLSAQRRQYDDDDDDDEEDEEEDDLPPSVDVANFKAPTTTTPTPVFGYNRGRSSPSVRTAMGKAGKSPAQVFVCTNCGGESVQWRGKCPTCQQWNTLQAFSVARKTPAPSSGSSGGGRGGIGRPGSGMVPRFSSSTGSTGGGGGGGGGGGARRSEPLGWLDDIGGGGGGYYSSSFEPPVPITQVDLQTPANARIEIPFDDELNAVLGGGLLKGSLILLGGDPGVGKSTLALQLANQIATHVSTAPVGIGMGSPSPSPSRSTNSNTTTTTTTAAAIAAGPVWYVSGEETMPQIATRAQRLQEALSEQLYLLSETNLNVLADQIIMLQQQQQSHYNMYGQGDDGDETTSAITTTTTPLPPSLLVIDSIQTVFCEEATGGTGGISQVRECMALLLRLAKSTNIPIVAIGHVTKTGDVAGPRMVEHMVDAVLYLEGSSMTSSSSSSSSTTPYRWLRASKNRFGSTQVVGLYEFVQGQLRPSPELDATSQALPTEDLEGCAMSIMVEGLQRAMTVEVQALVALSPGGFGKKTVEGISVQRLSLLLGVLQKHCGVFIGKSRDVYVQVVGGNSASSRASGKQQAAAALDLAVAMALTSSLVSVPVRADTVFLAQVGLLGELRSLSNMEARLLQAERMGFSRVIVAGKKFRPGRRQYNMEYLECPTLKKAIELGLTAAIPKRSTKRRSSKQQAQEPGLGNGHDNDNDDGNGNYFSKSRRTSTTTSSKGAPETVEDLELNDIIVDDGEDDEYQGEGEWF
jgi:DNA repair protein RadA/Sms